jgi:hypothetical protein
MLFWIMVFFISGFVLWGINNTFELISENDKLKKKNDTNEEIMVSMGKKILELEFENNELKKEQAEKESRKIIHHLGHVQNMAEV